VGCSHKHVLSNKSVEDKKLNKISELTNGAINLLILLIFDMDEQEKYSYSNDDVLNEIKKWLNDLNKKEKSFQLLDVLNGYSISTTFSCLKEFKDENVIELSEKNIDGFNKGRTFRMFTQNEIDSIVYFLRIQDINNLVIKIKESIDILKPHCLDFIKIRSSYWETYLKKYGKNLSENPEKDSLILVRIKCLQKDILPNWIIEKIHGEIDISKDDSRAKQSLPIEKKESKKVINEEYKHE
jgi:hypothetical protein